MTVALQELETAIPVEAVTAHGKPMPPSQSWLPSSTSAALPLGTRLQSVLHPCRSQSQHLLGSLLPSTP